MEGSGKPEVLVFGGTTEGRALSVRMAEAGAEVTVCVATDYGSEEQPAHPGIRTRVGPLTAREKQALLRGAVERGRALGFGESLGAIRVGAIADQVFKVCPTVIPKYSLTSQNPESLK